MSGKARHAVRMSNLLEKSRHVNIEAVEDPTLINYLRLAEVILTPEPKKMSYYLTDLENSEEADKRMREIDEERKRGDITKAQMIKMNEENKKYDDIIRKKIEQYKKRQESNQVRNMKPIKVTNPSAGTEEIYSSIKEFAEEYGYKPKSVSSAFFYQKANIIQFKGLIIQKLK